MRVIIDARLYGLEHAGPGRYVMNLVDELAKTDTQNKYKIVLRRKYFESLKLPGNWEKILFDVRQYTFKEQIMLPIILYRNKPDLVHFPHLNVPILYFGKFIVTLHDTIMHKHKGRESTTRNFPIYQIWRLGYHLNFTKAAKASSHIITPTRVVKQELMKLYKLPSSKITAIYEGVDAKINSNQISPQEVLSKYRLSKRKYFLFVGSAYPHKNLDRAIRAIVRLNKGRKAVVEFAIVSSRSVFTQRLEEKINKFKAQNYVRLLGFVPDSQLGVLYKNSIAFVYPSLSEGFGLPGLEAIKSGTLAIISELDVFDEVYGDYALKVDQYSVESICKAMKTVLNLKSTERNAKIKKAQKFISKYSWKKMAHETIKVYKSQAN